MTAPQLCKPSPVLSFEVFVLAVKDITADLNAVCCHKVPADALGLRNEYHIAICKTFVALALYAPVSQQLTPPAYDLTFGSTEASDVTFFPLPCFFCRCCGKAFVGRCCAYADAAVISLLQFFGQCGHGYHILHTVVIIFDHCFQLLLRYSLLYVSDRTAFKLCHFLNR